MDRKLVAVNQSIKDQQVTDKDVPVVLMSSQLSYYLRQDFFVTINRNFAEAFLEKHSEAFEIVTGLSEISSTGEHIRTLRYKGLPHFSYFFKSLPSDEQKLIRLHGLVQTDEFLANLCVFATLDKGNIQEKVAEIIKYSRVKPQKILVVDDQELYRNSVRKALSEALPEATIIVVSSKEEALKEIKKGAFDIIFADNFMPRENDGINLIKAIRNGDY